MAPSHHVPTPQLAQEAAKTIPKTARAVLVIGFAELRSHV